jgi:hypothetical protein
MEIKPYESAVDLITQAKLGSVRLHCRKQKMLMGDPCNHPIDICMALSKTPGAFDIQPR